MLNIIAGTAGHVDHGKTCLIKALTGIDTDRLLEEKKRGITIENGYAHLPDTADLSIGFIDVPGHEKYVGNMLTGIGGIDLALLVIALDEGVKPQTREHFEILRLLGIPEGIIVYTKADLVPEGPSSVLTDEVTELIKGSFLEGAERVEVSAFTGIGICELKSLIYKKARELGNRRKSPELFRLPVDRVFSREGFGTVVTGTLLEGRISKGEEIVLFPSGKKTKVRGIQVHGQDVLFAEAGSRTALNLGGIARDEVSKGEVAAFAGQILPGRMVDVVLTMFSAFPVILKNNETVNVCFGAGHRNARVVLLGAERLERGDRAYAQLRFGEEVPLKTGDRIIIRSCDSNNSVAGGMVVQARAAKKRHSSAEDAMKLRLLEDGNLSVRALAVIREVERSYPEISEIAVRLNLTISETKETLFGLLQEKKIARVKDSFVSREFADEVFRFIISILSDDQGERVFGPKPEKGELVSLISSKYHLDSEMAKAFLEKTREEGIVVMQGSRVALPGEKPEHELSKTGKALLEIYRTKGIEPPSNKEISEAFAGDKSLRKTLGLLLKEELLIKVDQEHYMWKESYNEALSYVKETLAKEGQITVAMYRDHMKTSRKFSKLMLEHLDRKHLTRLSGDAHIPVKRINDFN
ncbi:MAG: selenocysteine-specific translation elongation factor [Clostridiales bacterium]|nr:selenocysteine-specific translation elongation factor [Clostridiales bacterium]